MRYRNKFPKTIEAIRVPNVSAIDARLEFDAWVVRHAGNGRYHGSRFIIDHRSAWPGDYLVKTVEGVSILSYREFEVIFDVAGEPK